MIDDLPALASALITLIQAQELEKAQRLVCQARRAAAVADLAGRQRHVHTITLAIAEAKRQRARVVHALEQYFPDAQVVSSRAGIDKLCRDLFADEIASLTTMKRRCSLPARH